MTQSTLVTYATKSKSTADVAERIGEALGARSGSTVDVLPIAAVAELGGYGAVIVGGPMMMGWQEEALKFVARHQGALSQIPHALFITCLSLTSAGEASFRGVPLSLDPTLAKAPRRRDRLSLRERSTTVASYLGGMLDKAPGLSPASVGFFNGKLDSARLDLSSRFFVRYVIGAKDGDFRNWRFIERWGRDLAGGLELGLLEAS